MGYFSVCGTWPPLTDVFIAVQFCLSVKEMDAKKGGRAAHQSIHPSISFPLRGLDFSGETKVIRLHVIPQMQQKKKKALKTASAILAHKNLELNFLLAL